MFWQFWSVWQARFKGLFVYPIIFIIKLRSLSASTDSLNVPNRPYELVILIFYIHMNSKFTDDAAWKLLVLNLQQN